MNRIERVVAKEISRKVEPLTPQESTYVYGKMGKVPIVDMIESLPNLVEWNVLDDRMKLHTLRNVLAGELHTITAKYGDHRTQPTKEDPLRTPYYNLIFPWLGQCYQVFGREKFARRIKKGKIDSMVRELREKNLLQPHTDLDSSWISVASSTGNTPNLWQYDQGLQMLEQMREIAKGKDWALVKDQLNSLQLDQDKKLKRHHGFIDSDILVRMPSGTELVLLDKIMGSKATLVTDETGTNTKAGASGRHTSLKGPLGHVRTEVEKGIMPKLDGLDDVEDAKEAKLRYETGEYWDSEYIKAQTELWINDQRSKDPERRLTLVVTAGGKTNIGWDVGGLSFNDALELRRKYGGEDGMGILITVDDCQGRLEERQIKDIVEKKVRIDITGSKYYEGGMFSAFSYIPKEYAELARDYILQNGMPAGLSEYVSQSDMAELLFSGEESRFKNLINNPALDKRYLGLYVEQFEKRHNGLKAELQKLSDIPDIFSVLKWQAPIEAIEKYAPVTLRDKSESQTRVRTFVNSFRDYLPALYADKNDHNWLHKVINGHTWKVELLEELPWNVLKPKSELLMPIRVYVDGKMLSEKEMRAVQKKMGQLGKSGKMVQLGQYVAGANVIRVAPGFMTEIGIRRQNFEPELISYKDKLCSVIGEKLQEVMEEKLMNMEPRSSETGLWSHEGRVEWRWWAAQARDRVAHVAELNGVEQKIQQIVEMYEGMLMSDDLKPVVLLSFKNTAALDIIYQAWVKSGRGQNNLYLAHNLRGEKDAEYLPIVYVDHPYALIGKDGETVKPTSEDVYSTIIKTLRMYPYTHLYLWGSGEEIQQRLIDAGYDEKRFTVIEKRAPLTDFEKANPTWYKSTEPVSFDDAQVINDQHKGNQTKALIKYFSDLYHDKYFALVRGNNPRQDAREHTAPINIGRGRNILGFHPTYCLNQEEILEWVLRLDLPETKEYIDWLKKAYGEMCAMEREIVWEK